MKTFTAKHLAFLFISFWLCACGAKKEGITETNFVVSLGAIYSGNSSLSNNAGLIVMGRTLDDKNSFKKAIVNATDSISLPNGTWEFYAIVWEGDTNLAPPPIFSGAQRCGYVPPITLSGGEQSIAIITSQTTCSVAISDGGRVASPNFLDESQFKPIELRSCEYFPSYLSESSCMSSEEGASESIRIRFNDAIKENFSEIPLPTGISSACINKENFSETNLKLPVGFELDGFADFTFESFEEANCQGNIIKARLGHHQPIAGELGRVGALASISGNTVLFIPHPSIAGAPGSNLALTLTGNPNAQFNVCQALTIDLKDSTTGDPIVSTNAISLSLNSYGLQFFDDPSCTTTLGSYPTISLPAGTSTRTAYFESYSLNPNIQLTSSEVPNSSPTLNITTDTTNFTYASIDQSMIQSLEPLIVMDTGIPNADTNLQAGDVLLLAYDNIIAKIEIMAITASQLDINYKSYDRTNHAIIDYRSATLFSASSSALNLNNGTVTNYSAGLTDYQLVYNNIKNLNLFEAGAGRGIFYLK
jgi:hypothetical protein